MNFRLNPLKSLVLGAVIALFFLHVVVPSYDVRKEVKPFKTIEIKQEVEQASYLDGTYYVSTKVWVRNEKGFSLTLELWEQDLVIGELIESTKKEQAKKAEQVQQKLKYLTSN